jgi:hypothetical protein
MTLASASGRKELEQLSRQAKTTEKDFQALAFATKTYGVNAEQIADISKDIADKVGEFSAAGTGAFQDYADVMKLTKEEARGVAESFEGLSSQEIIGKMVSEMESAGVTGDKMTFVLESMGNDLSKLIPLFSKNSSELNTLKKRFNDVNDSIQITEGQANSLKGVSDTYSLLTSQIGNATTAISATLAPVIDDFFNDIIEVVPDATQTIIDFVNTFLDAENITTQAGITKELENSQARITELQKEAAEIAAVDVTHRKDGAFLQQQQLTAISQSINLERIRIQELSTQAEILEAQKQSLEDANRLKGGEIGGANGDSTDGLGTGDEIQKIADRFKTEEDLLVEKLDRELEIVGENKELRLKLEDEFLENLFEMEEKRDNKKRESEEKALSERAKLKSKAAKAEIALENSVANNAISLTKMVLGDSKAAALIALGIQKAQALSANATATYSGSLLAYSSQLVPGDPTSVIRAEAARDYTLGLGAVNAGLIVATGLGEAAGIVSGGGGGGGFGVGGSAENEAPSQQNNFEQETTSLDITDAGVGGSTTQTITFATDSGDELIDAISNALNKAQREGRT